MRFPRWLILSAALLAGCGDDAAGPAQSAPGVSPSVDASPSSDASPAVDADVGADASTAETQSQTYSCPIDLALTLQQATVEQLRELLLSDTPLHVVDVREPSETAAGVIDGALLYPWTSGVLTAAHENLPTGDPLYVICRSGNRSLPAASFLVEQGHACVFNVQGGMNAWTAAGYETVIP